MFVQQNWSLLVNLPPQKRRESSKNIVLRDKFYVHDEKDLEKGPVKDSNPRASLDSSNSWLTVRAENI